MLRARTSIRGSVCHAFDGHRSIAELYAVIREFADIRSHVGKAVDRIVRVFVQLFQILRYCLNALPGSIHDRLYRVHFELVLVKARPHRIHRQRVYNALARVDSSMGNVVHPGNAHAPHKRELAADRIDAGSNPIQAYVFGRAFQLFKAPPRVIQLQALFQLVKRFHRGADAFLELLVVELHLNNPFVNRFAHALVTSFQTLPAICSNIGLSAGLM